MPNFKLFGWKLKIWQGVEYTPFSTTRTVTINTATPIRAACDYYFFSRDRVPSKPVNRFWRTIAQKTRYGARMCLLGVRKSSFVNLRVFCPKNPLKIARNRDFPAKTKTSNNFETPQDRQKMSMDHEYKTGVSLSESIFENVPGRPLAEIQRWRHLRHSQKPHYLANGTW